MLQDFKSMSDHFGILCIKGQNTPLCIHLLARQFPADENFLRVKNKDNQTMIDNYNDTWSM